MTSRRMPAAVSALVLAALVVGVPALAGSTGSVGASSAHTIALVAHYEQTSFKTDDIPPEGSSPGDQIFFSGSLTQNDGGTRRFE